MLGAPFLAQACRAPSTRRSLVPSRREPLSEASLNRQRGLRAAPFVKIPDAHDVYRESTPEENRRRGPG